MKVLVTGASGFLGRHVVAALLAAGHDVRVLLRPAARLDALEWADQVEVARADLRARDGLAEALAGVEAVVHLAAQVGGDDHVQFAGTVVASENLFEAMARSEVRRLVLAGSFTVYATPPAGSVLDESSPLEAELETRGPYTASKSWQERVARRYAAEHGWTLTVLRPGAVWGPGAQDIPRTGVRVGRLHLVILGGSRLPLTHVENCARCFAAALEEPRAAGRTINVVDSAGESAWRVARVMARQTGDRALLVPVPYRAASLAVSAIHALARAALGPAVKLPSVLVPAQFEARFRPLGFSTAEVTALVGTRSLLSFEDALERTFSRPAPSPDAPGSLPAVAPEEACKPDGAEP